MSDALPGQKGLLGPEYDVTDFEDCFGPRFEKYPELDALALDIGHLICNEINRRAWKVKDDRMPYKAQYVLEKLIEKLQAAV